MLLIYFLKTPARRKPELLDATTCNLSSRKWESVVKDYLALLKKAEEIH